MIIGLFNPLFRPIKSCFVEVSVVLFVAGLFLVDFIMNSLKAYDSDSASVDLTKLVSKRWAVDLASKNRIGLTSNAQIDNIHPVGFADRAFPMTEAVEQDPQLQVKRSWDIALGPMRQLPMNMFVMWMTGNSISILPIMMVFMMFTRPISVLLSLQSSEYFLF